jgi:ribosomal-protein-alanine N-acetyltransferase
MRPENVASKQVALKCGFEFESLRKRFLHIDGDWRDHHTYVKLH